jgi:hypothetical protein
MLEGPIAVLLLVLGSANCRGRNVPGSTFGETEKEAVEANGDEGDICRTGFYTEATKV